MKKTVLTNCRTYRCGEIIEVNQSDYSEKDLVPVSETLPYYILRKSKFYCTSCKREALLKELIGKKWYEFWK